MRLFYSTTSPYARIVRLALAEKGLQPRVETLTDPWQDAPELLTANPSARVPTLVADSGLPLSESLLIVMWLEARHPTPSLIGSDSDRTFSRAGIAIGAIDAAAALIIVRKSAPDFPDSPVGLRRRRSVVEALQRLEADPPTLGDGPADLAAITAIVLRDYIAFRFGTAPWRPATPRLDALAARAAAERHAFAGTAPREMPPA